METRRLILFVALSTTVVLLYIPISEWLFPPPQQEALQKADPKAENRAEPKAENKAENKVDPKAENKVDPKVEPPQMEKEEVPPKVVVKHPRTHHVLGSLEPQKKSRLVIYFDSRGGAVERVELVERDRKNRFKYRNLLKKSGYLGHLALNDESVGGCRINLVVPGSPAAQASCNDKSIKGGLRVGDRITAVNQSSVKNKTAFFHQLEKVNPGKSVTLEIDREFKSIGELTFTAMLTENPMELIAPDQRLSPNTVVNDGEVPSFLLDLKPIAGFSRKALRSLRNNNWEVHPIKGAKQPTIEFHFSIEPQNAPAKKPGGPLEVIKRYRLTDKYHIDLDIIFQNQTASAQQITYQLDGPNGLPLEGWWYSNKVHPKMFRSAGARDVVWKKPKSKQMMHGGSAIYKYAQDHEEHPENSFTGEDGKPLTLDYIGVDTQYFAAILLNKTDKPFRLQSAASFRVGDDGELKGKKTKTVNSSFFIISQPLNIDVDEKNTTSYRLFLGPKDVKVLKQYQLQTAVEYGWFSWVVKPLAVILHLFYSLVGNFGLAIMMLTIVVRGAMFPISRKATRGAQMMQFLAPEMKKIAEKYKNDMEKRSKAQRELFSRYNYNPFGGCLLMFFQLPVFIGLYRCLSVDIALRGAPLFPGLPWCGNLAAPDMLFSWGTQIGWINSYITSRASGYLGPYFNILPIITITFFILQQKLFTPPATDDQTRMQQKMMKYMMVFMGVLFFKVASGLCLYFIISSLWGIAERKLLPKVGTPEETAAKAKAKVERSQQRRSQRNGNERQKSSGQKKGKKNR